MRVHISLDVASAAKSAKFYSKLFGTGATKVRDGYANFRLDQPPIHLALQENCGPVKDGISHMGIELPDHEALEAWQARLEDGGVDFAPENEAKCCYARADKLWLTDPDGYRWEVWVRTGEIEAMGGTRAEVFENREAGCC